MNQHPPRPPGDDRGSSSPSHRRRRRPGPLLLAVAAALLSLSGPRLTDARPPEPPADPLSRPDVSVPPQLRPWIGWALHDHKEALCPALLGKDEDGQRCAWPTSLTLDLSGRGGRFSARHRLFHRDLVPLPGDDKVWPGEVRVDGKPAVVLQRGEDDGGGPVVLLEPGEHLVTGTFLWEELPESLAVPPDTGLLALTLRGAPVPLPVRDDEGRLFLGRAAPGDGEEEDVLEVSVHRLLSDEVPLEVETRLELRVAGRGREVLLPSPLLPGFSPRRLDSPLPARLLPDGRLQLQARAGSFTVTLHAHRNGALGPVRELALPPSPKDRAPLAESELWAFAARPSLRVVQLDGVPAVDPQQTRLPAEWRRLPCFAVRPGDTLRLREQRRGDVEPAPDQLTLSRSLWLDFDGGGLTARDTLGGAVRRALRLEVDEPLSLGRAAVDGVDQLVTRGDHGSGKSGVEIRKGALSLEADLRLDLRARHQAAGLGTAVPASGWRADLQSLSVSLYLPPGWRLLHASGADDVPGTWLRRFTLLQLFLVLIYSLAVGRLFGRAWGALALVTLALLMPEADAPRWTPLPVLAATALLRLLPEGRLRAAMSALRVLSLAALVLTAAGFAAGDLRRALYPALSVEDGGDSDDGEVSFMRKAPRRELENAGARRPAAPSGAVDVLEAPKAAPADRPVAGKMGKKRLKAMKEEAVDLDVEEDEKKPEEPAADAIGGLGTVGRGAGGGGAGEGSYKQLAQSLQSASSPPARLRASGAQAQDPQAAIQTGPGVPRWRFTEVPLHFSGPVAMGQELRLHLLSPAAGLSLALLRVLLLCLLLLRLLDSAALRAGLPPLLQRALAALLPLLLLLSPGSARADDEPPMAALLEELRDRLVKPPACHPRCAASQRLVLDADRRALRLKLTIGAAAPTAVPLPGSPEQWLPVEVLVDGRPAAALRSEDGHLWLQLSAGNHEVSLAGPLPERDTVQLPLPLRPHRVQSHLVGWRLDGVHEDGEVDEDLQLTRERGRAGATEPAGAGAGAGDGGDVLPPFLRVERELQLGLQWQVVTTVLRLTPASAAAVLEVPLLPGESVTSAEVRVKGGKAQVNLPPGSSSVSWRSLLQEQAALTLSAGRGGPYTELWRLDLGPQWHVELSGLSPVHPQEERGLRRPEWRPWPGEEVRLRLWRLPGAAGQTLTIDHSRLRLAPGARITEATLDVSLRASRGGEHALTLPPGAQVQEVLVNGAAQPIHLEGAAGPPPDGAGARLVLPLRPGESQVVVKLRLPGGVTTLYRSPRPGLGAPAVNQDVEVRLGDGRWLLLCGGPRLGPAVLFWSQVLLLLLLSPLLARVRAVPLRAPDWVLLGIGLTQVELWAAALVGGFLLALGHRRGRPELSRRWLFNLRQLGLALWGAVALLLLMLAVREGLLGEPSMMVRGNGSSAGALRWFADRTSGAVPGVWVLSLPLWVYRVAMLLWALWLARALLGWLRWGYEALSAGGLWHRPQQQQQPEAAPQPETTPPSPPDAPPAS